MAVQRTGLGAWAGFGPGVRAVLRRVELMVVLPALMLAAFRLAGEGGLAAAGLSLSLLAAVIGAIAPADGAPAPLRGVLMVRPQFLAALAQMLKVCDHRGRAAACLVLRVDGLAEVLGRHGAGFEVDLLAALAHRVGFFLRDGDLLGRVDGGIAVALAPLRQSDPTGLAQIGKRLQQALADPMVVGPVRVSVTVSVGGYVVLPDGLRGMQAGVLLRGAEDAARAAAAHGPGTLRAAPGPAVLRPAVPQLGQARDDLPAPQPAHLRPTPDFADDLVADLGAALATGAIRPHFQPQVCTDTDRVSGLEALVRWHHPVHGLLPPKVFLPLVEQAGLTDRLTDVVLRGALECLSRLDARGQGVPGVSINLSPADLHDPLLARRIEWELDRANLRPHRLTLEVLETVVADAGQEVVLANLRTLSALGCGIDLDDFGMGQAGLANLRRFAVARIKIDRSFVTTIDRDPEQQRMVAAILAMAERLGLATVAEGVETPAVHAILGQLGCAHVQGFGIARPMTEDDLTQWLTARPTPVVMPMRLGRR